MKIIFITGGARSGKSSFAMSEALKYEGRKAFIATAEALDEEMRARIETHKRERGIDWDTYEEPLRISEVIEKIKGNYNTIVLDCLTLWLSNLIHSKLQITDEINNFVDVLTNVRADGSSTLQAIFIVSNEVGMGIVPENEMARKFRDWAGILNQKIAEEADEVYMIVAGMPVKIK